MFFSMHTTSVNQEPSLFTKLLSHWATPAGVLTFMGLGGSAWVYCAIRSSSPVQQRVVRSLKTDVNDSKQKIEDNQKRILYNEEKTQTLEELFDKQEQKTAQLSKNMETLKTQVDRNTYKICQIEQRVAALEDPHARVRG